ncbi:MAG: DUF1906 domain-containing protein [Bryobacterales bacterium]|nr:DUF1906 domain-containing protein [Bryobacterales bacterium]
MLGIPIATSGIAGFDIAFYPGDQAVQWLWDNSNMWWMGYYLMVAGPGFSNKATWQGKFEHLRSIGWGVAPIYVGKQPTSLKLKQRAGKEFHEGLADGAEACRSAVLAQVPRTTVLYFDLEYGHTTKRWLEYFWGWVTAVLNQQYVAGLYCSYLVAGAVESYIKERGIQVSPDPVPVIWAFHPTLTPTTHKDMNAIPAPLPLGSGTMSAVNWQFAQHAGIHYINEERPKKPKVHLTVDLNSSYHKDPGTRSS